MKWAVIFVESSGTADGVLVDAEQAGDAVLKVLQEQCKQGNRQYFREIKVQPLFPLGSQRTFLDVETTRVRAKKLKSEYAAKQILGTCRHCGSHPMVYEENEHKDPLIVCAGCGWIPGYCELTCQDG